MNKKNIIFIAVFIAGIVLSIETARYFVRQHQVAEHKRMLWKRASGEVQQDIDSMNKKYNYKPK